MRHWLLTLLFFFGPLIFLYAVRAAFFALRLWWLLRMRRHEPDVIDITPRERPKPSRLFRLLAVLIALVTAFFAWMRFSDAPDVEKRYIPAHLDAQGRLIPGHFE